MAKQCKANTKKGERCPNPASLNGYCFTHDPARGVERAQARKQGGLNRRAAHGAIDSSALPAKVRTLADVLTVLDYALAEAVPLENGVQRGRLLVSIAYAFIEAVKTGELEQRIAAIEAALKVRENKDESQNAS